MSNNLSGPLVEEWGVFASFPRAAEMNLASNQLTGPFAESWATSQTAMVSLMVW